MRCYVPSGHDPDAIDVEVERARNTDRGGRHRVAVAPVLHRPRRANEDGEAERHIRAYRGGLHLAGGDRCAGSHRISAAIATRRGASARRCFPRRTRLRRHAASARARWDRRAGVLPPAQERHDATLSAAFSDLHVLGQGSAHSQLIASRLSRFRPPRMPHCPWMADDVPAPGLPPAAPGRRRRWRGILVIVVALGVGVWWATEPVRRRAILFEAPIRLEAGSVVRGSFAPDRVGAYAIELRFRQAWLEPLSEVPRGGNLAIEALGEAVGGGWHGAHRPPGLAVSYVVRDGGTPVAEGVTGERLTGFYGFKEVGVYLHHVQEGRPGPHDIEVPSIAPWRHLPPGMLASWLPGRGTSMRSSIQRCDSVFCSQLRRSRCS
jgi:hypothetical protein